MVSEEGLQNHHGPQSPSTWTIFKTSIEQTVLQHHSQRQKVEVQFLPAGYQDSVPTVFKSLTVLLFVILHSCLH